jgi:hypothetical protein
LECNKLRIRFLEEEGKEHECVFWMMGQVIGLRLSFHNSEVEGSAKRKTWICE